MKRKNNIHHVARLANIFGKVAICLTLLCFAACRKEKKVPLANKDQKLITNNKAAQSRQGIACGGGPETDKMAQGHSLRIKLWEDGYITYIISNEFSDAEKNTIRQALKNWEIKTGALVFRDVQDPIANVVEASRNLVEHLSLHSYGLADKVAPRPDNKVPMLRFERHASRCYATSTGCPATLPAKIYAAPNCDLVSYMHEIGHIIGLIHEHQRVDRGDFLYFPKSTYDFIHTNYPTLESSVYFNLEPEAIDYTDPFPMDFSSIMMYGSYPRNAVELKEDLMQMGSPLYFNKIDCSIIERPTNISDKDVKLVRQLYPRRVHIVNGTTNLFYPHFSPLYPQPRWPGSTSGDKILHPGQLFQLVYDFGSMNYCFNGNVQLPLGEIQWNEWDSNDGSSHSQGFTTNLIAYENNVMNVQAKEMELASTVNVITPVVHDKNNGYNVVFYTSVHGNRITIKLLTPKSPNPGGGSGELR
jgi:hypothetical protein